jgi:hypothetical protein
MMLSRQADSLIALRAKTVTILHGKVVNIRTEAFCDPGDPARNKVDTGFACIKHDAPRRQFEAGSQSISQGSYGPTTQFASSAMIK